MGADIHAFAEVRTNGIWQRVTDAIFPDYNGTTPEPFTFRSYAVFGFLADVRNYSHCKPLGELKGLPKDSEYLNQPSKYGNYDKDLYYGELIPEEDRGTLRTDSLYDANYHSHSYYTLKELLDFDYDQSFWDRRISRTTHYPGGGSLTDGTALAEEGEGSTITYREHLGSGFFDTIKALQSLGEPENVRVVFWFDN